MPLAGRQLLPREIAQLGASHWRDEGELVKMVATALGESGGFVGAWHDNLAPEPHDGNWEILSRDCGLMQINLPARAVGTIAEAALRTESRDATESSRVARANVLAAYHLYEEPWDGRPIRRWQPWVAYTTGWATFPEFWVWHQVEGKPVGPWLPTGRYLQRAIAGVANFHLRIKRDATPGQAVDIAVTHAARFGVVAPVTMSRGFVAIEAPRSPSAPPPDGIGPRPRPNDGA